MTTARRMLYGLVLGFIVLVVLDALAARLGLVPGAIPRLPGTSAWLTSRAAGVVAFLALTLDVATGLFVSTGVVDRWLPRARSVELHRTLSSAALGLVAVHALSLTLDSFMRFDVIDALLPFTSGYRPIAVGLGVLAAQGALALHASFQLRRRIGGKTWRKLHYASFFVYVAALLHGVLAGSDTGALGMQTLYVGSATLVAALLAWRVGKRALQTAVPRRATQNVPRM